MKIMAAILETEAVTPGAASAMKKIGSENNEAAKTTAKATESQQPQARAAAAASKKPGKQSFDKTASIETQ